MKMVYAFLFAAYLQDKRQVWCIFLVDIFKFNYSIKIQHQLNFIPLFYIAYNDHLLISIYNTHCIHHSTDNYLYITSYTYTYISFISLILSSGNPKPTSSSVQPLDASSRPMTNYYWNASLELCRMYNLISN